MLPHKYIYFSEKQNDLQLLAFALFHLPYLHSHFSEILVSEKIGNFPADNYMFEVNNRNTRTRCEICSKLTVKTPGVVLVP